MAPRPSDLSIGILGLAALLGCQRVVSPAPATAPTPAASAPDPPPVPSVEAAEDPPPEDTEADAADDASLQKLSKAWSKDPELTHSGNKPADDLARCRGVGHDLRPANRALVPPPFVRFEGIATRACDAVLWVYLGCMAADAKGTSCQSWAERLVLEPAGKGAARALGDVAMRTGGNSGGLFVPFAFTRGDAWILLRAWMFSPGAGGGAVDYGAGVIARTTSSASAPIDVQSFPARAERYYAGFGCAIGVAGSDKTPSYMQPGFPADNGGALVVVDLTTLRPRTLLEEPDTTYAVTRVDEKARAVDVEVTRHAFGKDCPRSDDGALSCSTGTTVKRRLALPACPAQR